MGFLSRRLHTRPLRASSAAIAAMAMRGPSPLEVCLPAAVSVGQLSEVCERKTVSVSASKATAIREFRPLHEKGSSKDWESSKASTRRMSVAMTPARRLILTRGFSTAMSSSKGSPLAGLRYQELSGARSLRGEVASMSTLYRPVCGFPVGSSWRQGRGLFNPNSRALSVATVDWGSSELSTTDETELKQGALKDEFVSEAPVKEEAVSELKEGLGKDEVVSAVCTPGVSELIDTPVKDETENKEDIRNLKEKIEATELEIAGLKRTLAEKEDKSFEEPRRVKKPGDPDWGIRTVDPRLNIPPFEPKPRTQSLADKLVEEQYGDNKPTTWERSYPPGSFYDKAERRRRRRSLDQGMSRANTSFIKFPGGDDRDTYKPPPTVPPVPTNDYSEPPNPRFPHPVPEPDYSPSPVSRFPHPVPEDRLAPVSRFPPPVPETDYTPSSRSRYPFPDRSAPVSRFPHPVPETDYTPSSRSQHPMLEDRLAPVSRFAHPLPEDQPAPASRFPHPLPDDQPAPASRFPHPVPDDRPAPVSRFPHPLPEDRPAPVSRFPHPLPEDRSAPVSRFPHCVPGTDYSPSRFSRPSPEDRPAPSRFPHPLPEDRPAPVSRFPHPVPGNQYTARSSPASSFLPVPGGDDIVNPPKKKSLADELVEEQFGAEAVKNMTFTRTYPRGSFYDRIERNKRRMAEGGTSDISSKLGDWVCPRCDFRNFSRNRVCHKCQSEQPEESESGIDHGRASWHT